MEIFKTIVSFAMGTFGAWMMWRGKKMMDTKMMVWGGVLVVLSYWMFSFSWGGGNEVSPDDLKKLLPKPAEPQQP